MAECGAVQDVFLASGSAARLSCDLDAGEAHAGSQHGVWWSRCSLEEHGHSDPEANP